jgi:hypothetical protein
VKLQSLLAASEIQLEKQSSQNKQKPTLWFYLHKDELPHFHLY